jgi:hypothetical protein
MLREEMRPTRPLSRDVESWARGTLAWRQPHWRRTEWELLADGQTIATMVARGSVRERTVAHGPSGDWEFQHRWTGAASIAPAGSDAVVASYEAGMWGGGVFTTASSLRYLWTREGFWRPQRLIATESGFACIRFGVVARGSRHGCNVTVEPAGLRIAELEALLLLGWRVLISSLAHAH